MDEAGSQSHDELARKLEQKIREGERASQLLSQLKAQITAQFPPSMLIQRPAIDYPIDYPPSTSRIEEVPNYDSGTQVQHRQFQGPISNQQTHHFMPQVTAQPVVASSYQPYISQQRTAGIPSEGQSQQHSQQPTMQNNSSRATSYTASGSLPVVPPQRLLTGQDQGNYDSHSRPMASTQEQRRVSNLTAIRSQINLNDDRASFSNQNATQVPHPTLMPTTLPSMNMHYTQFIRELRQAIKHWEVEVPPNSYVDHPSNYFRVHKDLKGVTRIIIPGHVINLDQFCDWIRRRNVTTSVTPAVPANSRVGPSSASNAQKAIPSTVPKGIPSTVHKANVQHPSSIHQFTSATPHRPEYPQPVATLSKQTPSTMSMSMRNQGTGSSTSQIQLSTPSIFVPQPNPLSPSLPPSMAPTSSVSVPKPPSRYLSTIVNGVPRSVKQADKKYLASHILFGLGKRSREPDTSPTALTEPQLKRHTSQATGQVEAGVGPSASYTVGHAAQAAQKLNVPVQITPYEASTASFSLQQPPQHVSTPPTISQETWQISQASSSMSSSDRQELVNAALATSSDSVPLATSSAVVQTSQETWQISQASSSISSSDRQEFVNAALATSSDSVPLATSSTVVQTSTLPSSGPLTVPVAVSSELSSGLTQPVASSALKQPQPQTPAKLQQSFASVPSPSGTSAQIPQKNEPLFLPSPVSSPGLDENDDTSIRGARSADMARGSFDLPKSSSPVKNRAYVLIRGSSELLKSSSFAKRKNHAFVLAPPRPPYLVKYLELKMSRALKKKRMTSRSSVSTSVAGEEDFYNAPKSQSSNYADEQEAVQLACTRLQELSCKWDGCSVKMNSVDALIRHLNRQHKPSSTSHSNSFLCRWTQCGRRCNLHEKHLEKHASLSLNCPYQDCEESFRSASPLWKHIRTRHKHDTLKPSTLPSRPEVKPPDAFVGVIPSYMITTRGVNPDEISSARHAILGPRILRNIAGLAREKSRNKLKKTVRSSNGDIIPDEDTSNDYDFLIARPIRYSSQRSQSVDMGLEDLNSEDISRMVDEGLTLWGGKDVEDLVPLPSYQEHTTSSEVV